MVGACTALVFALHPAQTDAVAYISGGSQVLAATFVLSSLLTFAKFLDAQQPQRLAWWLASALAMLLALGARETAAVLPLALGLRAATESGDPKRVPWLALAASLLLVAAALWLGWRLTAYSYLLDTSLATRAPLDHLGVATRGVFWLAGQLVRWDRLTADPALDTTNPWSFADFARAVALCVCIAVAIGQWRARRWLSFGVLWFLLWLAPTHTLLARLDLASDRHLYLPLVGLGFTAAVGVARLRRHAPIATALLAGLFAYSVASRNLVWRDGIGDAP